MRAVENRRFLIRATNDGLTAVIDPAGRLIQLLEPYKQFAAPVRYGLVKESTFYARFGDWFVWTCLAAGLVLSVIQISRRAYD
jgi:apolipoprotein N-acyltransferase